MARERRATRLEWDIMAYYTMPSIARQCVSDCHRDLAALRTRAEFRANLPSHLGWPWLGSDAVLVTIMPFAGRAARRSGFGGGGASVRSAAAGGLGVGASSSGADNVVAIGSTATVGVGAAPCSAKEGWFGLHGRQYPATVGDPERSHIGIPVLQGQTGHGLAMMSFAGRADGPFETASASRQCQFSVDGIAPDVGIGEGHALIAAVHLFT